MTIGEKIKELRLENGITQEKLAQYLKISYQSVSKWERGTALPDVSMIVPIARFFGVTTDEIFGVYKSDEDNEVEEFLNREHFKKLAEIGELNS